MGKWIFSVLLLLGSVGSNSHVQHLCKGFLPENSMWIPDNRAMNKGLTELEFNQLLDRLQALYAPEFAQRGATFMIERNWADGTVNAYAYQDGNDWIISMFGGMARHPAMTYDGFAAIACHEVGHHMGGAPKYSRGDWASVEGQSDYYATAKCLKRLFEGDDNGKILAEMNLDPTAVGFCESEQAGRQDQELCIRGAMAAVALAGVLQDFEGSKVPFSLATPDQSVVRRTSPDHPAGQCRTDTYFQGSLCRVGHWQPVSDSNAGTGYCADSRTFTRGLRPRCWYAPN